MQAAWATLVRFVLFFVLLWVGSAVMLVVKDAIHFGEFDRVPLKNDIGWAALIAVIGAVVVELRTLRRRGPD
jgi:hypothetical protein